MRVSRVSLPGATLSLCCLVTISGCGGSPDAKTRLDEAAKSTPGVTLKTVFPLAGKVTIDGQPPSLSGRNQLFVILCDPAKLDEPPESRSTAAVSQQGDFAFTSYAAGDGVPEGDYIVTFAQLEDRKKKGLKGPDKLKNLYNDPDKAEFKVSHKSPGKKDHVFDLKVKGREGTTAAPRAFVGTPD